MAPRPTDFPWITICALKRRLGMANLICQVQCARIARRPSLVASTDSPDMREQRYFFNPLSMPCGKPIRRAQNSI